MAAPTTPTRSAGRTEGGVPAASVSRAGAPASAGPAPPAAHHEPMLTPSGRLLVVVLVTSAASFVASLAGARAGLEPGLSALAGLIGGTIAGLLVGARLVASPMARTAADIRAVTTRLERLGQADRNERFESILLHARSDLSDLTRAIHGALTRAHRHRLEAARVRREMDQRVHAETRRATAELSRQSLTDPLTDLPNRRRFELELPRLCGEARASGSELALFAIDMDNFKALNDTCGHAAGDEALRALAEILRAQFRQTDVVARLGGDEFVVLVPGCTEDRAVAVGTRLQTLFGQHPTVGRSGTTRVGISVGVAFLVRDGAEDPEALRRLADEALYGAKRAGRGCVCTVRGVRRAA